MTGDGQENVFVVNILTDDLSMKFILELQSFAKKVLNKVIASPA